MEEHETEIAYWAGRLIGYDQAWEVAEEIVETIKKAQNQALRIHDVSGELCRCTGVLSIEKVNNISWCKKCRKKFL
jgi:hypothetical protein